MKNTLLSSLVLLFIWNQTDGFASSSEAPVSFIPNVIETTLLYSTFLNQMVLSGTLIDYPVSFKLLAIPYVLSAKVVLGLWVSLALLVMAGIIFVIYYRRQQMEKLRIRQSEQALSKVLQYLPTGIILVDPQGHICQVNNAALRLFELEDADIVIGQMLDERQLFSRLKVVRKEQVSASGKRYIIQDAFGNEKVVYNEKNLFFLQSEKYVIETYHDWSSFTPRNASELTGSQAGFITNISHELRTPLNGIIGMTDLLLNSIHLPAQEKEMATVAKRSAETLLTLINDILDFSKLDSGKFEIESIAFNLKDEIEAIIHDFVVLAREKKIQIVTNFGEVLPHDFIGDPLRVRQVMNNLINNAIKFTPSGKIEVSAKAAKTTAGAAAIQFSIRDTGIGIRASKLKTIFEPFVQGDETTTREFGGTGLGTTISKQLVNLMGGEIWVNSPSGLLTDPNYPGSEFSFTLPLKTRRYQKTLDFSAIQSYAQIRAHVITDDPMQVHVLTRNLIALGVNFQIASPTIETIESLKVENDCHLLIIDHRYDLNGLEFLQELHNSHLHKKHLILMQSSDFQASNTSLARRMGADVYLRKPIPLMVLRQFLERHFPNISERERTATLSIPEVFHVMVIEESVLNQRLIVNLLHRFGYHTSTARSINEAIANIGFEGVNLILLEADEDADNNEAAIVSLQSIAVSCPVLLIGTSANLTDMAKKQYEACGFSDFLIKPVTYDGVVKLINKWGMGANEPASHR